MPRIQVNDSNADAVIGRGATTSAQLRELACALENLQRASHGQEAVLSSADGRTRVAVPTSILAHFEVLIGKLADQDAVGIVGVSDDLTTQQAADLLGVSRQYVVRLIDEGRLAHHMVGTHRRVRVGDVLAFKRDRDAGRRRGMQNLIRLSEEFGGYDAERRREP